MEQVNFKSKLTLAQCLAYTNSGYENSPKFFAGEIARYDKTAKLSDIPLDVSFQVSNLKGQRTYNAWKNDPSLPLFADVLNENYSMCSFGYSTDKEVEQHFKIFFITPEDKFAYLKAIHSGKNKVVLTISKDIFVSKDDKEHIYTKITFKGLAKLS